MLASGPWVHNHAGCKLQTRGRDRRTLLTHLNSWLLRGLGSNENEASPTTRGGEAFGADNRKDDGDRESCVVQCCQSTAIALTFWNVEHERWRGWADAQASAT